ncbi:hypothetical protein JCM6882_005280 [Rhodosporidiobolus microsporus]
MLRPAFVPLALALLPSLAEAALTNKTCPAENTVSRDQSDFWDGRWDAHEIGWVIAGATAAATTIITLYSVLQHALHYYNPKQQRQVIRIMWMPAVYGIVSFFSYRFFRSYTYYSVAVVAYESLVLAAFLMLLLQYIGESTDAQKAVLRDKEKQKIPFPFWCIRYRPSKPYFLHALKWSVLQYSVLRPLISITEIICQAYDVLCPTAYSIYFAEVYLDSIDFVSISVALYGLIALYDLTKEQLAGRKPLSKFLAIKFVVMLTFYQSFIFSVLESHDVIKATEYWTATNVADGLNALCICCEMVIMSIWFAFAFNWAEYKAQAPPGAGRTNPFWGVLDSFNYWDFLVEGYSGISFLIDFIRRKPGTHAGKKERERLRLARSKKLSDRRSLDYGLDVDAAFAGVEDTSGSDSDSRAPLSPPMKAHAQHQSLGGQDEPPTTTYSPRTGIPMTAFGRPSESDDPYPLSERREQQARAAEWRSPAQGGVFGGVEGYGGAGATTEEEEETPYEMEERGGKGVGRAE